MKKALQINLTAVFGAPCHPSESAIQPLMPMSNGDIQYYHNPVGQVCQQQFDGLMGYINLLDFELSQAIVVPLHVEQADIHIFYLLGAHGAVQIKDLQQDLNYSIYSNRGRYIYLYTGDYELHLPAGRYTIVNFYFRGSIFRNGNERPFQFLHPLIAAYRKKDPQACCSIDFRVGPRTISLMKTIVANIKKGDVDSELNILCGIKKLINLSKEKIFEEYNKISQSQLKSKEAYSAIKQAVAEHGQDFKLEDIAMQLGISMDYLHQVINNFYGLSPQKLKIDFMLDLAKKYIADGRHTDEVAYELGYASPSSFARFFKNKTGMTATEFFKRNNP